MDARPVRVLRHPDGVHGEGADRHRHRAVPRAPDDGAHARRQGAISSHIEKFPVVGDKGKAVATFLDPVCNGAGALSDVRAVVASAKEQLLKFTSTGNDKEDDFYLCADHGSGIGAADLCRSEEGKQRDRAQRWARWPGRGGRPIVKVRSRPGGSSGMVMEEIGAIQEADDENKPIDPAESALVTQWTERVCKARTHWNKKFDAMRKMQRFIHGKQWMGETGNDDNRYVVNLALSHINQRVAAIHAKNPRVVGKAKTRMWYSRYGTAAREQWQAAQQAVQQFRPERASRGAGAGGGHPQRDGPQKPGGAASPGRRRSWCSISSTSRRRA